MAAASLSSATAAFIDTNLDTHLAVDVFDHDTASDLKKRIESEHRSCFPEFGHIHVHRIKVKRKGYSYQLADSMCVRNAFSGFKKSWYISVQVSALGDQLIPHGSPNQVVCHGVAENALVCHADNSASKRVSSLDNLQLLQSENKLDEGGGIHNVRPCVSEQTGEGDVKNLEKSAGNNEDGIPVHGSIPEAEERGFVNHEVLPSSSGTGIKDVCDVHEDDLSISVPSSKTKQKRKRTREDAVPGDNSKDNDELPNSHIECAVDGSNKGIKEDSIELDEGMCKTAPATKKRKKSKRKKEDTVQYENEDNIASVDNPPSRSSERTSSMNNSQVPLLEKKQDENEEVPVVGKVVKNLEIDVKSSGNNDPGISLTSSLPETRDSCCVNHELPNSHIECAVDGSNKGIKEDSIVPDDGICKTALATKKRHKSKRKKEDTVQGDNSKDNIASVDNPPRSPSSMNNSQVPLLEKKQDENEEVPVVGNVVKKLEIDVKSSGNNDPDISFTRSLPETRDNCCVNHELPNSHIECVVDGSNKGIKEGSVVPDEGMCKTAPATKKRQKSKREKEDTVQGDNTKDNITSVDNPLSSPPQRASSLKNFHMPQLENKQTVGAEEECDVPKIHPDKKVHKVHKTRQDAKMSSPSDSAMSSVKVNSKPRKSASGESMDLDKRREHLLISNSKLESSNKMVKDKAGKASGNNVWGVVSNIQQRKSLLAGGIFKDDNSWTSQDEADNSDVSTRTRSDNSLMSDSSDGDSSSDLDSQHGK